MIPSTSVIEGNHDEPNVEDTVLVVPFLRRLQESEGGVLDVILSIVSADFMHDNLTSDDPPL